jgi:predicted nucleic acid-binding protein
LLNTVWLAVREGMLPQEDGLESLAAAEQLGIRSIDPQELWTGAYRRALDANHPGYDTLFVELAARESIPLATFDNGILTKFSEIAQRPRDLVDLRTTSAWSRWSFLIANAEPAV